MADPWEQDWSRPAQTPSASPWDHDWSGAGKPAPVAKQDGQMASGFKRSFEEVPGLAAGVAAYGADVLGATETRDALIQYAQRKNDELAAAHANDAQSITDTWDGKTGWLDFLANSAGYVAGQALQSIATGGLGAVGARMLAKQGARELAEGVAAREIAAGASEKAAQAAVANALAQSASKTATRGAIAGAGAHNFGMELGSIYPDAVEEADGADNLDGGDKFRILAAASLAAGVDTAGEAIMASRFLKGSKAGATKVGPDGVISEGPGLLGRAAREIPAGMARESVTEGIQTGIEQWGAAKTIGDAESIKDIVDAMGVGAVGGALGGAAGARKARQIEQASPEPVTAILAAPDIDTAIAATRAAIEEPTARERNAATADEIRQLAPELQSEAIGLLSTSNGANTPGHVRRFAQNRLDEMLAPLRTIPVGEVIEDPAGTIPVPDTQELTSTEATSQILQPPDPAQIRAVGTRIPTGRATEIAPENIELGNQIPVGDVIEAGGDAPRPDGMPERRNTDGLALDFGTPQHFNAPHSVFQYVQTIAGLGTPASRAFVQDYKAGRITNDDVLNLLVPTRREPTANQRLEAAAAQAPKTEALKPGDLLTSDGKPYGVRVAAAVRAKKEGGTVVEVQGGWAVRPKESPGAQPDLPVPAAVAVRAPDGAGDQPGGSSGTVRPVADAGRTGQVYPGVPEAAASGIADRPAAGPGSERDQALTSNGFIAAPNGYKVRIARHQRGSNALDPTADVGAFTYEVRKGDNDPNPLTMVVSKDGKLVPAKSVLTDNKSNGTAWVPRSEESANTVSGLLAERAGTAVGSPERKAVDAKIAEAVAADKAGPTGGSAATNQALSDDLPTLKAAWSEAAARGDDAAMKRLNDRIVQAKMAPSGNPAPGAGLSQPAPLKYGRDTMRKATDEPWQEKFYTERTDNGRVRLVSYKNFNGLGAFDTEEQAAQEARALAQPAQGTQKQDQAGTPVAGPGDSQAAPASAPTVAQKLKAKRAKKQPAPDATPVAPAEERPMPDEADPLFKLKNLLRQLQNGLDGDTAPSGNPWFKEPKLRASTERSVKELQERIAAAESNDGASEAPATVAESATTAPAKDDANTRARNWAERTAMPDERAANEAANSAAANDPTLDDELNAALGHLGDVLGDVFGAKLNITGPQHSAGDLLPALSKVVELLVRKGFKSFGQAAGKAAQLMRANSKTAAHVDAISPRQWKAAYQAIGDLFPGTDSEEQVSAMSADDVLRITGKQPKAFGTAPRNSPDAGVEAGAAKVVQNGDFAESKPLTNLGAVKPGIEQGNGRVEIQAFRSVQRLMGRIGQDFKILKSVVQLIPVDVVDVLVGQQLSAEMLFHDPAMLENIAVIRGDAPVSSRVNAARAVIEAVARATAEDARLVDLGGVSIDFSAALRAVDRWQDGVPENEFGNDGPQSSGKSYNAIAEPAAPTLADKIKAKRAEAAPQPEPVAEESAPQPEPAPEAKPVRNDALIDLRKQLSVLKSLRACLG